MNQSTIAENICKLCEEQGWTVEEFAEAIELTDRQVNRYRNCQFKTIPIDLFNKMADVLHVNVLDLLS